MANGFPGTLREIGHWLGGRLAPRISSLAVEIGDEGVIVTMTIGEHRERKLLPAAWEEAAYSDFDGQLDEMARALIRRDADSHGKRDDS